MMRGARFTFLAVLLAGFCCAAGPETRPADRRLAEVLGVTHAGGMYQVGRGDYLNEGAERAAGVGSRVIKLWMGNPRRNYPFNSDWPKMGTLEEMARSPYFRSVFQKPFSTFILVAYRPGRAAHRWQEGPLPAEELQAEQRAFYDLAKYLLSEYRDTGKTFVLQNWEGDWAARGHVDPKRDPAPQAFEGMILWMRARQTGVEQARREVGERGVRVLNALEMNLVRQSMPAPGVAGAGRPGVVNEVLPKVDVDLASYSAYDTQEKPEQFRAALQFISQNMVPRKAGGCRVYVGELGVPENKRGIEAVRRIVPRAIETALDFGCPYVVYWQLYCNEPLSRPVKGNADCSGFWLIKPDGTRAWMWHYLNQAIRDNRLPDPSAVTCP